MDISFFSNDYTVRRMEKADVADIYLLCSRNGDYIRHGRVYENIEKNWAS